MKEKNNVLKFILTSVAILIFIAIIIYLYPVIKDISTEEGQIAFKEKVDESGVLGMLLLFGLQVAHIFLFVIPGEPIEVLAGMCYGALWGTVFIMVTAFIVSTSVFFLVRKLGRKFVYSFCKEERVNKIENSKLFRNPKKLEIILLALFLIPGTPKDLLVYIAGLLPIKPLHFILITSFARFPSVISSTLVGANLATGDWKISLIIYGVSLILAGIVLIVFRKKVDTSDLE